MNLVHHIKVYGKDNCPKCSEVITALENSSPQITYQYLKMGKDFTRDEIMEIKPESVREFPVCFISNTSEMEYIPNKELLEKIKLN